MMFPIYDPDTGLVRMAEDGGSLGEPWRMRGAVCLPCLARQSGSGGASLEGVILVAGQSPAPADKVEIFEEHQFFSAGPVVDGDRLVDRGATAGYSRAWTEWFCREYYVHQPAEAVAQHQAALRMQPELPAKPRLIEVEWRDVHTAEAALWERLRRRALSFPKDGRCRAELKKFLVNTAEPSPWAWAVLTLCAGAARFPVRRPV